MKNKFILLFLIFTNVQIFSQNIISGFITDAKTKKALPDVYVFIPELNKTSVSDSSGFYQISNMPNGTFTLQFSYIGYKTQIKRLEFTGNKHQLDMQLHQAYIESQEIVISSGAYSSQHENAIKIESIKANKLAEQGGFSIMENLSGLPGVSMISKGKGIVTPVIRGLSTTNIVVLNNGVRMENFQFSENHPIMISEGGIDKVEVIKGPASLLYGADAIGGVINFIHERPAPIGRTRGDAHITYFTNTRGIQSNIGIKHSSKNVFWGLRLNNKSHCDYLQGNGQYVPNSRFNEQAAHLFAGFNKHFGSFKLYYDYDQKKLGLSIPSSVNLVNTADRNPEIWFQDLNDHILVSKNKVFLDEWKLEANFSYQNNHRILKTNPSNEYFVATDMLLQTLTYDIHANWTWKNTRKFIFGYHGMNQNNTNSFAPQHVLPDYNLLDNSLFVLYQQSFSSKFHSQMGLRYDNRWIDVPEQLKTIENISSEKSHEITKSYQNISGSLGFTMDLLENLLLRANLASAYRTPSIAELTQDGMHGNRYERGNIDLVPQRNYEVDLSIHFHIDKLKFDVAVFYNQILHYIYLSNTNDSTNSGIPIYQYTQNNSHLSGLEAGIEYQVLKCIKAKASYAHVLGVQENGDYLPFIPQDKLNISLQVKTDFAQEQHRVSPFETPSNSYFLLNASMGSSISIFQQKIFWSVNVTNALNEQYIDHLSTLKPMSYYNMGRNFSFSLKIPFDI